MMFVTTESLYNPRTVYTLAIALCRLLDRSISVVTEIKPCPFYRPIGETSCSDSGICCTVLS